MNKNGQTFGDAFLGKALENLSQILEQQSFEVFAKVGILVPVKSCSTFMYIASQESCSSAEIARSLAMSHQLIKQKVATLISRDLVKVVNHETDKRKRVLLITDKGKEQYLKLQATLPFIEQAYQEAYSDLGFKLIDNVENFKKELVGVPLIKRMPILRHVAHEKKSVIER